MVVIVMVSRDCESSACTGTVQAEKSANTDTPANKRWPPTRLRNITAPKLSHSVLGWRAARRSGGWLAYTFGFPDMKSLFNMHSRVNVSTMENV
jgi:hypothetical protein